VSGVTSAEIRTIRERAARPPLVADLNLEPGENPRPTGRGWLLVDYNWDEDTGVARLVYRRRKERLVVDVKQPAGRSQAGWRDRPAINHAAVLARYFESQRDQLVKLEAGGVYGR
jgi:hypothetical protein